MDNVDRAIVQKLSIDSRTPFLTISKEIGVSEGTIRQRVAKMQKAGVIKKFTLQMGTSTTALIEITTSSSVPTQKISDKIKKLGVLHVYEVTGRFSIIAIVQAEDFNKLNNVLEFIRSIDGVVQTETFPVLKEY
ncbi:MAG: Lrp/AsnC family transcriptional regulator [archaeon]|jgi:Lrp/AsnC family transcriptional regulator of lysine biosynthesis